MLGLNNSAVQVVCFSYRRAFAMAWELDMRQFDVGVAFREF